MTQSELRDVRRFIISHRTLSKLPNNRSIGSGLICGSSVSDQALFHGSNLRVSAGLLAKVLHVVSS